jgi:glycogen operon protein
MLSPGRPLPARRHAGDPRRHQLRVDGAARPEAVELCLFDGIGQNEQQRLRVPAVHQWLSGMGGCRAGREGLVYGYRVHGPWAPAQGAALQCRQGAAGSVCARDRGVLRWRATCSWGTCPARSRPQRDGRDNGASCTESARDSDCALRPAHRQAHARIASSDRVLYEMHVRGQTRLHPGGAGRAARLLRRLGAEHAVLDHLQHLGVTTLSLMPVQHIAPTSSGCWKHQASPTTGATATIGWFAPEARYWSGRPGTTPASEFRAAHRRGACARHGSW